MWACCCTGQVDKWLLFLERAGLDVALHKEVVPIILAECFLLYKMHECYLEQLCLSGLA